MKIYLGIPRYMSTKLNSTTFPSNRSFILTFIRINLINSRDISIKDFTMRSSTLNKTREDRDTSRRSFLGALFDEDHKIHLKNWSSQRSFIHSSSLVAVYAVNSSFQNKPIDPRVPRQCQLHLWNSCERPSYFFLFPPFFACIRVRHAYHAVYMLFMQTLWTCIAHDRNACLFSVKLCEKKNRITTTRIFLSVHSLFNCAKYESEIQI